MAQDAQIVFPAASQDALVIYPAPGSGGGSSTAQFLTLATDGSLTNERVFTPAGSLSGTDGGAGSTYTVSNKVTIVSDTTGVTTSDNAAGAATGITAAVSTGTYTFDMIGAAYSAVSTSGIRHTWVGTGGATCSSMASYSLVAGGNGVVYTSALGTWTQEGNSVTSSGAYILGGFFVVSVAGTLTLWVRPETAATNAIFERGYLILRKVA